MLLLARTTPVEEVKRRTDGLSVILVNLKESLGKGVEIRPIEAMINHNTTEVYFDNLKVPAENLIGEEGKGFRYILDGMNAERILVAQECIGDGRWLLKKGVDYAKERVDALLQQPAAIADAFLRHQDALGVHAVEDVAEALAFLADQILGRHFQVVEVHLGRVVVDHRLDRADL